MYILSYTVPGGTLFTVASSSFSQLKRWRKRHIGDPSIHWRVSDHDKEWIDSSYHDTWMYINIFPTKVDLVLYKGDA